MLAEISVFVRPNVLELYFGYATQGQADGGIPRDETE
jgi:hypothetical protein